jgi:hypothetical protein
MNPEVAGALLLSGYAKRRPAAAGTKFNKLRKWMMVPKFPDHWSLRESLGSPMQPSLPVALLVVG